MGQIYSHFKARVYDCNHLLKTTLLWKFYDEIFSSTKPEGGDYSQCPFGRKDLFIPYQNGDA